MVSETFWQKRLNSDPGVIGRGITLKRRAAHDRRRYTEPADLVGRTAMRKFGR